MEFAETTCINVELIDKSTKIASCLISTRKINVELYKELCQQTCNKWTEVFPGESLTPTMHEAFDFFGRMQRSLKSSPQRILKKIASTFKVGKLNLPLERN